MRLRLGKNGILFKINAMSGHAKKKHGVQLQEKILLVTTFIIGMVAGWYLYITAFVPHFNQYVGQTEAVYEDLVVVGDQHGGRRTGMAPSFQVLKDGSFNYVTQGTDGREGSVPGSIWNGVKSALTRAKVVDLARPVSGEACASDADGIDYTYTVTLQGKDYVLDTCSSNLAHDAATKAALDKLWNYFATLQ
jgi:hypothetical protein